MADKVIPTFSGMSVGAETIVRNILIKLSGAVTGIILFQLAKYGMTEQAGAALGVSFSMLISELVASVLFGVAAIAWGWWQARRSSLAVINNTIRAAITGKVPDAIYRKASTGCDLPEGKYRAGK